MSREIRALAYLRKHGRTVDAAWLAATLGEGSPDDLIHELAAYQNPDGGFGRALEPDIASPLSQPFAARIALHVIQSAELPSTHPAVQALETWLVDTQDEDGCWRFPPGLSDHHLAPWFAAWTFPSLNPALCLAGAMHRLGLGTATTQERVTRLFVRLASVEEAETGEFYSVLPYAEYVPWVHELSDGPYLDALVSGIARRASSGGYDDAGHFFDHAGAANGPVAIRLPDDMIRDQLRRLAEAQEADGSWPTPYAPHWKSWSTASAVVTLRDYGFM